MEINELVQSVEESLSKKSCQYVNLIQIKEDVSNALLKVAHTLTEKGYECSCEDLPSDFTHFKGSTSYYKLTIKNKSNLN
jgi:hypothetical protein